MYLKKLKPQCISCLLEKHLSSAPEHFSDEQKTRYMQGILQILGNADASMSAPVIVERINLFKESMGIFSDFSETKSYFNSYMLLREAEIENKIEASSNPLKTAVLYSIAGNYIDFGTLSSVDTQKLDSILTNVDNISLKLSEFDELRKEIMTAQKIAYITDNCGEIVLDKLLIKQIIKHNPNAKINVIVRGKDVLNDSTIEDAKQTGLCDMVPVIDNGTAIAGTCLERVSDDARAILDGADVIISKGQGNFETLCYCGKNIYYLFLCKCQMFAEKFKVNKLTGMLIREKNLG